MKMAYDLALPATAAKQRIAVLGTTSQVLAAHAFLLISRKQRKIHRYCIVMADQLEDANFQRASVATPLPLSTNARSSGPEENDILSPISGTPDFAELAPRSSHMPNTGMI